MIVITNAHQNLHLNISMIESLYFINEGHTSIVVRMVSGKEYFFDSSEAEHILAQYSLFVDHTIAMRARLNEQITN